MTIEEKYSQFIPLNHLCVARIIDLKIRYCAASPIIMNNIYSYYTNTYKLNKFLNFNEIKDYPVEEFDKILTLEILKNT